ncbi:MAG: TonB-dependent receptor [bacterium]
MRKNLLKFFAFAMIILIPSVIFAQDEVWRFYSIKDSLVVEAERYSPLPAYNTIATKVPTSLRHTPASVGVVTSSIFHSQDGVVLSDALKNISGVNVQSNIGVHDYFYIRGFDSLRNGLVLTDGTAEPEATFYNLYNIERIEVLKGPSAFLYGGNPLSGTVNLVRKQPTFSNSSRVTASYGEFATFRGTLDANVSYPAARLALRLNALYQQSDSYRDDKENDNVSVNPALTWRFGGFGAVTVNLEYVRSSYAPDSGIPILFQQNGQTIPEIPRTISYQSPFDYSEQQIYRAQIDFKGQVSKGLTLQNRTYFSDLEWTTQGTLLGGAFPGSAGRIDVLRFFLDLDDRQKLFGNQLEALFSFNTGSIGHSLLTGIEISHQTDDFILGSAFIPTIDLEDPVEILTATLLKLRPRSEAKGDAKSSVFAPYFVDKITFFDRCRVFFGGRYDVINYDDQETLTERDYRKFSPMFGFGYSPTNSLALYGNVGQAFAPPSTRTVGDRKPEESTQIEVGAKKAAFDGKLNATVALFQLEKDNIAIPDDNGVTMQTGNQRSRGIELELITQPTEKWFALASYAYTDAELTEFRQSVQVGFDQNFSPIFATIDRSGNVPAFAPKHILNLWFTRELPYGIGLGAGGRFVSDQYIAEDNGFKIDSVLSFDAAVFYKYGWMRFALHFKNFTSRQYEMRGFSSSSVIPADPRSIYCSAELNL